MTLQDQILALPCKTREGTSEAFQMGYKVGRSDALRAAASLVQQAPALTDEQIDAAIEALFPSGDP